MEFMIKWFINVLFYTHLHLANIINNVSYLSLLQQILCQSLTTHLITHIENGPVVK